MLLGMNLCGIKIVEGNSKGERANVPGKSFWLRNARLSCLGYS